ncbi:helix-turn-helix domain-containing protein [Salana multivorans]
MTDMPAIQTEHQLGAALRERRERLSLTQAQVAERAGVSRAFVTELERGRRPRAELMRVLAVIRALDAAVSLIEVKPQTAEQALDDLLGFGR